MSQAEGRRRRACFVDVETTGLSPYQDEIVELALVLFEFDAETGEIVDVLDEYVGLREPSVPIHAAAQRVHGISPEQVHGEELEDARVLALMESADLLIAHNARFDRAFVRNLFSIAEFREWACSMSDIDWRGRGFRSRGLQQLLADHGIKVSRAHRALDDVHAALTLLNTADEHGRPYFYELVARVRARQAQNEG